MQSSPIIVLERILSLYDARIRKMMDVKIFVLIDYDIRLAQRCKIESIILVVELRD